MAKKILIAGAFGYGNLGDNAIRDIELEYFGNSGFEVKWDSPAIDKGKVNWADLIIIGGGGILYDSHPDETSEKFDKANVDNYIEYAKEAEKLGKPYIFCCIGEQGIYSDYAKRLYREYLNKALAVSVRDVYDKIVLESIGIDNIFVMEDPVWLYDIKTSKLNNSFGLITRTLNHDYYNQVLKYLFYRKSINYYKFSNDDNKIVKELGLIAKTANSYNEMASKITDKFLIVNRFHGIIMSLLLGATPIVLIHNRKATTKNGKFISRYPIKYKLFFENHNIKERLFEIMSKAEPMNKNDIDYIVKKCKIRAKLGMDYIKDKINNYFS